MPFAEVAGFGWPLLAQEAGAAANDPLKMVFSYLPLVMIGLVFFFVILRPQQRERQRQDDMLKQIKKNDRVVTSGGIFGVVTSVATESGEVTIRVDEKNDTKIRMQLSAIARVLGDESPAAAKTDTT